MDLTPLYELRERLKAGAIAGTELLCEDFRLKRALETFAPLEQASPVFSKIAQQVRAALAPDCANRPNALLEAVTLVDAVLCTQGKVTVQGELEPLSADGWSGAVLNAPYSILAVLLDALEHSGSGRYNIVMEMHQTHPELFQDYRIKTALVQALGDSYAELADQITAWLKEEDPAIIPLLKRGFDPQGKKEMARRIKVIDALAGAQENDFYLTQLPLAEKEVKDALIYALRHAEENGEKLLELVKTEKGSARSAARWALACCDSPAVWAYWAALLAKKPQEAAGYLRVAATAEAGLLIADTLKKLFAPFLADPQHTPIKKETGDAIVELVTALQGKGGEAVCACYRQAAALGDTLDRPLEGQDRNLVIKIAIVPYQYQTLVFSQLVPSILQQSLLMRPSRDLLDLALELYETYGELYLSAALIAKLLTEDGPSCYQWAAALLETRGDKRDSQILEQMEQGLFAIHWNQEQNEFLLQTKQYCPADGSYVVYNNALLAPLEERFYDLLQGLGNRDMDRILAQWIQPQNQFLCAKLGNYFYNRALSEKDSIVYLNYMRACGWENCTGLLLHRVKSNPDISWWAIEQFIEHMPGMGAAKADEVQRLYDAIEQGNIKRGVKQTMDLDRLKEFIFNLRREAPIRS